MAVPGEDAPGQMDSRTRHLTGIDAPATSAAAVFDALGGARAVVAPARDGGINLIALRAPERALLSTIRPRGRDVFERCAAYFGEALAVLDVASDIDATVRASRRSRGRFSVQPLARTGAVDTGRRPSHPSGH